MILTRHLILSPVPAVELRYPRIGYHNLFRDGTVTVSSEDANHPKELAFDGLTYDGWRPTSGDEQWIEVENAVAEDADYMAVAAHTLAGCTLTPQYSTDGGGSWVDLADPFQPSDNSPIVWEFDTVNAGKYRLLVESAPDVFSLGAIHVGERMTLPRGFPIGWSPPSLNERTEFSNTMSEGGQILGRSVTRRGVTVDGVAKMVTMTWAREDWLDFIASAENYGFFFWRTIMEENEIVYGVLTGFSGQTANQKFVSTAFDMRGINR
jgi:hypothetical protein